MSLRDSIELIRTHKPDQGYAQLEHEILAERANSLSAAEKRVLAAMAKLDACSGDRSAPLSEARQAVWSYFVQRELNGFRKHHDVIKDLGITREILNGLGAQAPNRKV